MAGDATERAVRWERARLRHESLLQRAGMLPWRAARRLRYSCLTPAGPLVRLAAGVAVAAYLAWTLARGDFGTAAVLRALAVAVLFLLLSTNRASVTDAGLSFDVAGLRRVSIFGFVPLYAVKDVVAGRRPAGWPRGASHGAPLPGWLGRVHVRYEDAKGTDRVRSAWVRDPARYAETVLGGRPQPRPRSRRSRRR
jgi:hypothetical protein